MQAALPRVSFAGVEISRLLVGGNPFAGMGHRPQVPGYDDELRQYFTDEKVLETLATAALAGISAFHGRGDENTFRHMANVRAWSAAEAGRPRMLWLGQTAPNKYVDDRPEPNIEEMAHHDPFAIYIHGATGDKLHHEGRHAELAALVRFIHSLGLRAGIGGHDPEVIRTAHRLGLGADFYILSLRSIAEEPVVCVDEAATARAFTETPTPMLAIKVLAAGRIPAAEAFRYAASVLKPTDVMTVGMRDYEVEENVREATAAFAETAPAGIMREVRS